MDPATVVWKRLQFEGEIPGARSGASAVCVGRQRVVITGGRSSETKLPLGDAYMFDLGQFFFVFLIRSPVFSFLTLFFLTQIP